MNKVSIRIISIYRYLLSPFIGGQCRYCPTCSEYARQAIELYGPLKGWFLAFMRIINCHPWSRRSWFDPVPENFTFSLLGLNKGNGKTGKDLDGKQTYE
jgi:hypothetical protein